MTPDFCACRDPRQRTCCNRHEHSPDLQREGATSDVPALISLRDRLLAAMPSSHARRAAVDAGAMLEAQGYACRPGPRVHVASVTLGAIAVAIKAPFSLNIAYRDARNNGVLDRVVEPYGLLLGNRQYLIARDLGNGREFRRFRLIASAAPKSPGSRSPATPSSTWTPMPNSLSAPTIQKRNTNLSSGAFPLVRPVRRANSNSTQTRWSPKLSDAALRVAFTASGWVEMAWHLFKWATASR